MPKDALKTFVNTLLYSKEDVTITGGHDSLSHNNDNLNLRKDNNIKQRLARFTNSINEKKMSIEFH